MNIINKINRKEAEKSQNIDIMKARVIKPAGKKNRKK